MDNYVSVPDVPVLQSPSTGSTGISITPTLTWTASSGAITYRLQVATDTAFTKLIYDDSTLTATSKQVTGFTNNAKLYWRVNAKNTNGTSSYSTIWSFTTIVAAPQAPVLSSPANSATGQAVSLTLKWNSASTATSRDRTALQEGAIPNPRMRDFAQRGIVRALCVAIAQQCC